MVGAGRLFLACGAELAIFVDGRRADHDGLGVPRLQQAQPLSLILTLISKANRRQRAAARRLTGPGVQVGPWLTPD
jgi:hypothetical protein